MDPVEDRLNGLRRRTLAIGVFDPQDELSFVVARVGPIEERGTRTPEMKIASRTGRKTGSNAHRLSLRLVSGWPHGEAGLAPR
jgi:hypothetical protein